MPDARLRLAARCVLRGDADDLFTYLFSLVARYRGRVGNSHTHRNVMSFFLAVYGGIVRVVTK